MPSELINRDPFCPVQLAVITDSRGRDTSEVRIELQDEENEWQPLSGKAAVHGQDYALVTNRQVYDMVGDVLTRTGGSFKPVPSWGDGHSRPVFWNGRSFSAKWYTEDVATACGESSLTLGVEAINSYDGSAPVGIRFFAMHVICSNQFYARNMLGNFVFHHVNREAGIMLNENVHDAMSLVNEQATRFVKTMGAMRGLLDHSLGGLEGFLACRQAANERFWKPSRDPLLLDELAGRGVTHQLQLPQMTAPLDCAWRVLNAYTAVSTHQIGGFNGSAASEQATNFMFDYCGLKQVA